MKKDYVFRYGDGTVTIPLEENNVTVLHGQETPPAKDIRQLVLDALAHPIDAPLLENWILPGERVALIISDMSRFWMRQDKVIPHVVDYLLNQCGVQADHLTIVVANGTHIGGDEKELRTLVTDAIYDRIRVVNHDCLASNLTTIGTTSYGTVVCIAPEVANADRVIALGACAHHVMAGFGGGRKSILPGVSAMDTICHNHALALDDSEFRSNDLIGNGKLEGNPLNDDMCQAAGMVKNLFVMTLVMNTDMQLAEIYAGHYMSSWLKACEAVDRIYRVEVPEKADVIVASCGGYPKDMSLYQGTKTIDNIETGLKRGGTLILLIEARDGGGPAEYFDWNTYLQDGTMEKRLREHFTIPGYIFLLNCEQAHRYNIMMLSSVPQELVAPMGLRSYQSVAQLMADANLEGKRIYVIENGSTVIPYVKGVK